MCQARLVTLLKQFGMKEGVTYTPAHVRAAYREKARLMHPDAGKTRDANAFIKLREDFEEAQALLRGLREAALSAGQISSEHEWISPTPARQRVTRYDGRPKASGDVSKTHGPGPPPPQLVEAIGVFALICGGWSMSGTDRSADRQTQVTLA
eukprot:TRINITY_DN68531_c0_g1_i1.p1 TRINITY_DN68531_c0_g1~~TRINITY_DN68531_c0_g1_i1.p1  ORF type:complete len:173 (+),score=15.89 TRINITY_DN68531_c0_g1_i1:65-520(+)